MVVIFSAMIGTQVVYKVVKIPIYILSDLVWATFACECTNRENGEAQIK